MNFDFKENDWMERISELAALYVPKVILAIIVLIVGLAVIKKLIRLLRIQLEKRSADPSLIPFLSGIANALLVIVLILSIAEMVGVETTSFIAVLGAASLAIGLALQGSLSNFAGGVLILLMKPFKVGDVIEAQGVIASVSEIKIFHTVLKSYDGKTIILPNGPLYNDKIINYSTEPERLVEWVFGIGYDDDIDKARSIIYEVIFTDPRVLNKDDAYIKLAELADSSVNFKVRARVIQADFWGVYLDMIERIKKAFDREGISIPYPQMDAHIFNETKNQGG
ncbi:mechanosensitive ion channel family protein [Roseivirga sp. BDSF3-8]|uniref:mechanosensitive ion channel family protein n=1 Tax=Roseivirga sp. BDSF3-8 TaxID=3241598 RepID=UPI003531D4ED